MAAPDLETQLDEALISNDEERIAHILALMDGSSPVMPAPVSIDCYAHSHYFPGEPLSNLTRENIILLDCGHRIWKQCRTAVLREALNINFDQPVFQCHWGNPFNDIDAHEYASRFLGEEYTKLVQDKYIQSSQMNPVQPDMQPYGNSQCDISIHGNLLGQPCQGLGEPTVGMLDCGHHVWPTCLNNYFAAIGDSPKILWPVKNCPSNISIYNLEEYFSDKPFFAMKFVQAVQNSDSGSQMCIQCQNIFQYVATSDGFINCHYCGMYQCFNCNQPEHQGTPWKVRYNVPAMNRKCEHLRPCPDPGEADPTTEEHEHYQSAAYAFRQFVGNTSSQIVSVEWNTNPVLKQKFDVKKQEFLQRGLPTEEIFVWHGTAAQNIEAICQGGFMIPGKTSNAIAHGKAAGYGVYVGTGPDISMGYSGAQLGRMGGAIFGGMGTGNPFGMNPIFAPSGYPGGFPDVAPRSNTAQMLLCLCLPGKRGGK